VALQIYLLRKGSVMTQKQIRARIKRFVNVAYDFLYDRDASPAVEDEKVSGQLSIGSNDYSLLLHYDPEQITLHCTAFLFDAFLPIDLPIVKVWLNSISASTFRGCIGVYKAGHLSWEIEYADCPHPFEREVPEWYVRTGLHLFDKLVQQLHALIRSERSSAGSNASSTGPQIDDISASTSASENLTPRISES
jgi:hypothetical protein